MKSILFIVAVYLPITLFAQFPYDVIPLNGFNDLILFRDVNRNQKWHMKIQGNGALGFTETGVSDQRLTLNPGGGFGINAIPATSELLVVKTNPGDGIAKIVLNKDGQFRLSGNATIDGNMAINQNLSIFGGFSTLGKIATADELEANRNIIGHQNLTISNAATIGGVLDVYQNMIGRGDFSLSNSMSIGQNLSLGGTLDVQNSATIGNTLNTFYTRLSGYVLDDLGINVHPSTQVTFSVKAKADDTWVIYADDTSSDVKFYVRTNGDAFLKGSLSQNSDVRLKTSITKLAAPLQSLKAINGYSYFWKNNPNNNAKQIGLLAQEVMPVYPELVSEATNGTLAVNYTGFVPILIEAIKDQSKTIENQSEMIRQLELRMKALEDRLNRQ